MQLLTKMKIEIYENIPAYVNSYTSAFLYMIISKVFFSLDFELVIWILRKLN